MKIKVEQNVDLKQFTTYRTGGPARYFAIARNWQTIYHLREFAKKEKVPYIFLGGGSNMLFADEGYPGLIILNQMDKINFHEETVTAESGVHLMKLISISAQQNLGGISALANVPGTVGGAVYGNAGVPDLCIGDVLMHANILPANSNKPEMVRFDYFQFGYRTSRIKQTNDTILSATLKLKAMPGAIIRNEVNQYIKNRMLKQPNGMSCGSFFKNTDQFPSAGWLIDQSGCKEMKVGGAVVSPRHANFIINTGKATSSDILKLALQVHKKVKEKFNVSLEPEVQIIPENPFT